MSIFTIEMGNIISGKWMSGSRRILVEACDLEAAKSEADRKIKMGEMAGWENENAIRVSDSSESTFAWRPIDQPDGWENGNA